ncbi:MAG: hypothetical protein E7647_00045 [Ruminococcaceae bacterium]|nr:hypothetical protein [Oscillospiraceae bacterium]
MNFFKKTLALILSLVMLVCCLAAAVTAEAAELGTEANPENANDRYFSAAGCYLINTDLAEGDSDGYWYTFTATGAGFVCIDATARDAAGASTDLYQITVQCKGVTYNAFEDIYTRPVVPFRVSRNDVITIHMTARPDANGSYRMTKVYCNLTTVYGTESDPVLIKSAEGFVANVQAMKTVVYQDGTNGGLWGGKGIVVSADTKADIYNTEVILNGTVYTDKDKDGTIELMLPGDPNAQIAAHPIFSVYNDNADDVSYTIKVVASAAESGEVEHEHSFEFSKRVKEPTVTEEGIDLFVCSGCGETEEVKVPVLERWTKGDLNNDGEINAIDANLLKRVLAGQLSGEQIIDASDYNEDGEVNAIDAAYLRKSVSGIN